MFSFLLLLFLLLPINTAIPPQVNIKANITGYVLKARLFIGIDDANKDNVPANNPHSIENNFLVHKYTDKQSDTDKKEAKPNKRFFIPEIIWSCATRT